MHFKCMRHSEEPVLLAHSICIDFDSIVEICETHLSQISHPKTGVYFWYVLKYFNRCVSGRSCDSASLNHSLPLLVAVKEVHIRSCVCYRHLQITKDSTAKMDLLSTHNPPSLIHESIINQYISVPPPKLTSHYTIYIHFSFQLTKTHIIRQLSYSTKPKADTFMQQYTSSA